jgi:hypothetical protein
LLKEERKKESLTHARRAAIMINDVILPFSGPPLLHRCSDPIVERKMSAIWARHRWMHSRKIVTLENDFVVISTIY